MTISTTETLERPGGGLPWRFLELLAVFIAAISVVGMITMRLGVFQAPQIWITGFLSTYAYSRLTVSAKSSIRADVPYWHLLLVVFVALIFRLPPYTYLLGGQDEGIYMNMGAELARTGGLQPVDAILQHLSNPAVRAQYLVGNYQPTIYLPGVYRTSQGLEFQFYHLFPVWLALFKAAFGIHGAVYALTFLSLASLLYFQRLAQLISGSAKAALVAGLLLAVNPLHAFFSKFPVTEVPTLAFSGMAFCFLLQSWREQERSTERGYIAISLIALGLLFMTRISGFMYLPLIIALAVVAALLPRDRKASLLRLWVVVASLLYFCSVLYGLKWSSAYAHDIYAASFAPLFGSRWPLALFALALMTCGVLACLTLACRRDTWREWLGGATSKATIVLPVLILLFSIVAVWKAYKLGFTDSYSGNSAVSALSGKNWNAVLSVSLVAASIYLSPFLMLALLVSATFRQMSVEQKLLLLFVASFYGSAALLQWYLPYQPYYARYLVSELVPYSILFVVCAWAALKPSIPRNFLLAMITLGMIFSLVVSSLQIGKDEHRGLAANLDHLASRFDSHDLVLIDHGMTGPLPHELKTALVYTYGLTVATVREDDLASSRYINSLARGSQDVFFVSRKIAAPAGFVEADSVEFYEQAFCHGVDVPSRMCVLANTRLMVYRKPSPGPESAAPGDTVLEFNASEGPVQTLVGRKTGGGIVASGPAGFLMYGPYAPLPAGKYTVIVDGIGTTPFVLDLAASHGAEILGRKGPSAAESPLAGTLISLDFEVTKPVDDLEVRIQVPGGSNLQIAGYRVVRR